MKTMTIKLDGKPYHHFDDPLAVSTRDLARELILWGVDLSPRWEDDQRETILLDIPVQGGVH